MYKGALAIVAAACFSTPQTYDENRQNNILERAWI
jgi:hypothetical protein